MLVLLNPHIVGAAGASNASGVALPGAVSGWTLTMAEDFDTAFSAGGVSSAGVFPSPYASEANAYADGTLDTSGNNNGSNSIYRPSSNLSCTASKLVTLCNIVSTQIRSATYVVTPGGNYGQSYGRFSVCYRVPAPVHGFKIAFLMWPNTSVWPRDGELDWPEGSLYTGGVFGANFLHQGSTTGAHDEFDHHRLTSSTPGPDGSWHVATLEWASTFIRAIWDGVTIGTTYDRIPNTSMYWAVQTESDVDQFGTGGYASGSDTGTVEVDWVACWNPNSPAVPGAGAAPSSTATLTEPFTGTNGAAWNSTNWNSTITAGTGTAQIQTNKGRQTTGAAGGNQEIYRRSNTALPADSIILVTVNLTTVTECYPFICFRDATSGTAASGYQLYFYAANSQIVLANPVEQQIAVVNWGSSWTTSTSLKVEILTVGNLTDIRVWAAAGSRPTNPTMQTNTSGYTGGTCGLGIFGGTAAVASTVEFDDFSIASVP